jgi:hypothetical protein
MALFTAYFDASGNAQDDTFVVVAGYLANYLQWRMLETMWRDIHSEFEVAIPFHMSEFMAATVNPQRYAAQKNCRNDYLAILQDTKKVQTFFNRICIAQQSVMHCGISCIVDMQIYNGVSSLLNLREIVPPYALAARTCLAQVNEWQRQFDVQEPVECIFEKGDFEQYKFTELVENEGGPSPIYKHKKDYAGLQAADHYAWEQFHYLKKERTGQHLPARKAFKFLLNVIPHLHTQVTQAGLINLCHEKGIDPRTGVKHAKK